MNNIKTNRKMSAVLSVQKNKSKYFKEIDFSIKSAKVYDNNALLSLEVARPAENIRTEIEVLNMGSEEAATSFVEDKRKRAVLNFANHEFPGGGFISGAMAQEEALCHSSVLYNVLSSKELKPFFDKNKTTHEKGLHSNSALYLKDIVFFDKKNNIFKADIISVAAPNRTEAVLSGVPETFYEKVLKSRIKFILDIAKAENVKFLVLGAFGCGVFGGDAKQTAEIFKKEIESDTRGIEKIIFAVPEFSQKDVENANAFKKCFGGN